MSYNEQREKYIQGMKDCLQWLEANPEVPVGSMEVHGYTITPENVGAIISAIGDVRKEFHDNYIYLKKSFGPVEYWVADDREKVCKRVVVDVKVIPATPEYVIAAKPETTEEVVEWQCGSLLAMKEEGLPI